MNHTYITLSAGVYQNFIKPVLFRFDPEFVHDSITSLGEGIGRSGVVRKITNALYNQNDTHLSQKIANINFRSPVGLAAGFDYEAKLTQILPSLGFGFQTVGTITNNPYEGNPKPRLGRLPKSESLLVNKGFKNLGARVTAEKMSKFNFEIPVGISIGRTNSATLSQKESVQDILGAFTVFESSRVQHSYYELNISCPNLFGDVTFYTQENLKELLVEIDKLHIKRPVFIKMPIDKTNGEVRKMLDVIAKFSPKGVIFGNLQKNRKNSSLHPDEIQKAGKGNFSGKPTYTRSNELISLAYKHYGKRFTIVGCGGVFSALDAYEKITLGASLIQMITGLIFQGPQVVAQINSGLGKIIELQGVKNISEIIGSAHR